MADPAHTDDARRREQTEATKKRLADEKAAREKKQVDQRAAPGAVKPTPTQEENDLTASGEHVTEHEPDGSPPDPFVTPPDAPPPEGGAQSRRQVEANKPGGGYETRQPQPAQHQPTHQPSKPSS